MCPAHCCRPVRVRRMLLSIRRRFHTLTLHPRLYFRLGAYSLQICYSFRLDPWNVRVDEGIVHADGFYRLEKG